MVRPRVWGNVTTLPTAPFITWKLPDLILIGLGVQSFQSSDTFIVPLGVSQIEVELWEEVPAAMPQFRQARVVEDLEGVTRAS